MRQQVNYTRSTSNLKTKINSDKEYTDAYRDMVVKQNNIVTKQGKIYEQIKRADAAFGEMWKFENFLDEINSLDDFFNEAQKNMKMKFLLKN